MSDAKTPRDAASQAEDALEADAAVEAEVPEKLSVKANMIWNSIGSMTYLACQWFTTIFVVRLSSGYDDAGLLSLAMSVVGIFGTFANYKMGTYADLRHSSREHGGRVHGIPLLHACGCVRRLYDILRLSPALPRRSSRWRSSTPSRAWDS